MAVYHLTAPFSEEEIRKLKIGDTVYVSGNAFTCRSRLQRYIFDEGNTLPFDTSDRNLLIHNGPIVIKEDGEWRLVSFMPTSSIRFEKWGARSVEDWGLRMIIGKTTMGEKTAEAMKRHGCVHASPRSVSPNLWVDAITVEDVHLFDELGSIEAAWFFNVRELGPFIIDIDAEGNNYFDRLDEGIAQNKRAALMRLGIDEDFEFTKLY